MGVSIKVFSDGELLKSARTEDAPGILGQPKATKGDETSPGWTPAPVKDWNSRVGFSSNSGRPNAGSKDTTPIGEASASELATKLIGRLLQGEKAPESILKTLSKVIKQVRKR